MPTERKKAEIHRALKKKKLGASGKATRENSGTTQAFPLTGPVPTLRYGRKIDPKAIKVPAAKAAKPTATAKK